jgi:hypothetical protein
VLVARWSRLVLQRVAVRADAPYIPVWSEWIIGETWRTLTWLWLNRAARPAERELEPLARSANRMLEQLLAVMTLVSLRGHAGIGAWPELRDEDDLPIWQTAVVAHAQYVVSQNVRDFPPLVRGRHVHAGVEYLTAIEFVEDVLGDDPSVILGAQLPSAASIRSDRQTRPTPS